MTEPRVGDIIDERYELVRAIAKGGAGVVFEATHRITTRNVAIKLLRERAAGSEEVRERMLREARALTVARHPNVVAALDAGLTPDGSPYLVMELLEGRTLSGILMARGRMGVADTVHLGRQLCDGVAAAHAHGIVHRDIKPSNLFIALDETERESLKVVDFGIAAFRGQAQQSRDRKLTEHGSVIGTPEYMAPEQLLAQADVDQRCDIYGIGVTLYECLTGSVPFEGNYGRVLLQASTKPIPPLRSRREEIPEELAQVVERALARAPEDRYDGARELGDALVEAVRVLVGRTSLLGVRSVPPVEQTRPTIPVGPRQRPTTVPERIPPRSEQRRRYPRVPYITPVSISRTGDATLYGRSEDISEGGLLVMTAQRCDDGEKVRVRFVVPGTGQFVETAAVVRWARKGRTIGVVGFEFLDLPEDIREAIRAYVTTRTAD